ncbi:uncharacterized protein LOC126900906 [Daktulosphaira vitifoliae]|uniref:uncharacterized protein LOC126900906 n=1 Tax=Daktulosphaira vitifoliae TaxID=58002 RepID=UPI0021AAB9E8|nr:uncharacterized protein LOC126900906 [Daktulosphaira vitifoliae]
MGWIMTTTMNDLIGKTFTVDRKKAFAQKVVELERAMATMVSQCNVANAKLEESRFNNEKLIDKLGEIRKEKEMMEARIKELEHGNNRKLLGKQEDGLQMPPPNNIPTYSMVTKQNNKGEGIVEIKEDGKQRSRSRSSRRNRIRRECREQRPHVPFELNLGSGEAYNAKEELWTEVTKKVMVPKMTLIKQKDRIIVTAKDDDTLRAIKDIALMDNRIVERSAKWPKIMVKGVDKEILGEQISRAIAFSNREIGIELIEADKNIKPLFRKGPREADTVNWVIEVAPIAYERIMKLGFIYIKWSRCRVQEFCDVSQCFKCMKFGHIMTKCRQEEFTCKYCTKGHDSKNCSEVNRPKCANCGEAHVATSMDCRVRERHIRESMRRTDYGVVKSGDIVIST